MKGDSRSLGLLAWELIESESETEPQTKRNKFRLNPNLEPIITRPPTDYPTYDLTTTFTSTHGLPDRLIKTTRTPLDYVTYDLREQAVSQEVLQQSDSQEVCEQACESDVESWPGLTSESGSDGEHKFKRRHKAESESEAETES